MYRIIYGHGTKLGPKFSSLKKGREFAMKKRATTDIAVELIKVKKIKLRGKS